MSWIQQLYETYEQCAGRDMPGKQPLLPISHTIQQAHIEVCIDGAGSFKSARALSPREEIILPATEKSAGRTSGEAAHALADKIQYCARDYPSFGGKKSSYFEGYIEQLRRWCASPHKHTKAEAVLNYLEKGTLVADLLEAKVLHARNGILLTVWDSDKEGDEEVPVIFRQLTPKKENDIKVQDQGDALVRWRVIIPGELQDQTWLDDSLYQAWMNYDASNKQRQGLCLVAGEMTVIAEQHPAKLRHSGDKAKLISSNDTSGYTFRGRFEEADQACTVGFDVTQKSHNALRWLLSDQKRTFRNGEQAIVAWETAGHEIPSPLHSSDELIDDEDELPEGPDAKRQDAGLYFARRLKRKIAGYQSTLGSTARVVVMVLDAATPGRMAITYYRELTSSEFLARLDAWHTNFAWPQRYSKERNFIGAPAPRDIAEVAFGHDVAGQDKNRKLLKATVERLLPCIIDGVPLPGDLLQCAFNRACHPQSMQHWEWQKVLGIACALYKGTHPKENYQMSLETDRTTRDYLYGRLLAVADRLEGLALHVAGETRDTNAAKLLPRFATHPYSTWVQLEVSLTPYKSRLRAKRPFMLAELEKLLQCIMAEFEGGDFRDDSKLSGEFLLAYHCQNKALWESWKKENDAAGNETSAETETTSSVFNEQGIQP
jgi:CRISPR-associated protein Csd1